MAKVLGIGGTFFKAEDPEALAIWYAKTLQLGEFGASNTGSFGVPFDPGKMPPNGYTQWSVVSKESRRFDKDYMFNFIVDDIAEMIEQVTAGGGEILRQGFVLEGVGEFAWFKDPEGNQVELWQPSN